MKWCEVFLCLLLAAFCYGEEAKGHQQNTLKSLFNQYNVYIRPNGPATTNGTDGPVMIDVNMYILHFDKISHRDNTFDLQLYFRQEWTDDRLTFDDQQGKMKVLTLHDSNAIWTPDLFFTNEKVGHIQNIMKTNNFIKIWPNGRVQYSARISETLYCQMDLQDFPFDEQVCSLTIESYGYQAKDLQVRWKDEDVPVIVASDWSVPEFRLEQVDTKAHIVPFKSGEYSILTVKFTLKRSPFYYFIQVYIPAAMLVILSWLTFWMHPKTNVSRAVVVMTTLLMMFALNISNRKISPRVGYATAIDTWSGVCITFVFAALVEFVYVSRKDEDKVVEEVKKCDEEKGINAKILNHLLLSKLQSATSSLDNISKIIFPVMFVIFNIVYWSVWL